MERCRRAPRVNTTAWFGRYFVQDDQMCIRDRETQEQHWAIAALDSDFCQGFYFARPMSPQLIEELISVGPESREVPRCV